MAIPFALGLQQLHSQSSNSILTLSLEIHSEVVLSLASPSVRQCLNRQEYGGRDHGDGIIIVLYGRRSSLVPNPSIRKKRSFNRQPSQLGRGKQPSFLQALAAERDTAEEQNAIQKVEEAKASANRSVELAVQSRQRAQLLMNNADLATYRAAMALRIAEGALVCESSDAAATHLFLD